MSAAPRAEIIESLLVYRGGRRTFVPISRAFVQRPRRGGGPGPLSAFVRARRKRALDLYLLLHAVASSPPHDVSLPALTWARALSMPATESSATQISATLTWLEDRRLVTSERAGNARRVTLLNDDGSGSPYRHPGAGTREGRGYLKLPYAYWLEGWHERLDLPALSVLLIALSLPDGFILPQRQAAEWYGLSRDTLRRGLATLAEQDVLSHRVATKRAPLSPHGITSERHYRLTGPFASDKRRPRAKPQTRSPGKRRGAPALTPRVNAPG